MGFSKSPPSDSDVLHTTAGILAKVSPSDSNNITTQTDLNTTLEEIPSLAECLADNIAPAYNQPPRFPSPKRLIEKVFMLEPPPIFPKSPEPDLPVKCKRYKIRRPKSLPPGQPEEPEHPRAIPIPEPKCYHSECVPLLRKGPSRDP